MPSDGSLPASLSLRADSMVPPQDCPPPNSEEEEGESPGFSWGLPWGAGEGMMTWKANPSSAPPRLCVLGKLPFPSL